MIGKLAVEDPIGTTSSANVCTWVSLSVILISNVLMTSGQIWTAALAGTNTTSKALISATKLVSSHFL